MNVENDYASIILLSLFEKQFDVVKLGLGDAIVAAGDLKDIGNGAWKNKPIGSLLYYTVSFSGEVICKNVQNIN